MHCKDKVKSVNIGMEKEMGENHSVLMYFDIIFRLSTKEMYVKECHVHCMYHTQSLRPNTVERWCSANLIYYE